MPRPLQNSATAGPLHRVDPYDHEIAAGQAQEERDQRRVAGITAVPLCLPVNLDGGKQVRQAGRCENGVGRNVGIGERASSRGAHVRRADENLDILLGANAREVH
jgi:hypothetical protein